MIYLLAAFFLFLFICLFSIIIVIMRERVIGGVFQMIKKIQIMRERVIGGEREKKGNHELKEEKNPLHRSK